MRVIFYDHTAIDYNTDTPFRAPLGGSESAVAYLSIELAKLGHDVVLVTNTSAPGRHRGVSCSNHHHPDTAALLNSADVVINSNASLGCWLKDSLRVTR